MSIHMRRAMRITAVVGALGCGAFAPAAGIAGATDDLPIVEVERDNTVLDRPCRVVIAPGRVIEDADGNGVIHVEFDGGVVEFAEGSVLRGSVRGAAPDAYAGTGIRVRDRRGVTIRGARVEGFKVGLHATRTPGLTIEGCRFEDLWRHRLRSSPEAEDQADWLWPHENDGGEWRTRYGAGACIERSEGVTIRGCVGRRGQNGVILDRVERSSVYDNDFSFLSGWGLAMWRSSENVISRNAFDFCIRGYSHGVYNRGQDSAGILAFEQCSRNRFFENSVTHGGDGFFGFAGREALGEKPPPEPGFDYTRRGCNDNVFDGNDFSYAAAHGLELTFSFGNILRRNRFVENAICGVWGGYSSRTRIEGSNEFVRNGDAGYGLERGGVNIEHGRDNTIAGRFEGNACGVHLWWDEDAGIAKTPWAKANGVESTRNAIAGEFTKDTVAVHLRRSTHTRVFNATFEGCGENIRHDEESAPLVSDAAAAGAGQPVEPDRHGAMAEAPGDTRPVGARAHLAGRRNIIMTEWGPWDHESAMVRVGADEGWRVRVDLFNVPARGLEVDLERGGPGVAARVEPAPEGDPRRAVVWVEAGTEGVHTYVLSVRAGAEAEGGAAVDERVSGTLIKGAWRVRCFAYQTDPREDLEAWRSEGRGARGARGAEVVLPRLRLGFGSRGPADLRLGDEAAEAALRAVSPALPRDRFGTIARTVIPLAPGAWRVRTLSDDGVRIRVRRVGAGGDAEAHAERGWERTVIENWTHHGPTRDEGTFEVPAAGAAGGVSAPVPMEIEVEHFELDGYAVLEVAIERAE